MANPGTKNDAKSKWYVKEDLMNNIKSKKGSGGILAFIVIAVVVVGIIFNSYPGIKNATKENVEGMAKTYNSTDTIILD